MVCLRSKTFGMSHNKVRESSSLNPKTPTVELGLMSMLPEIGFNRIAQNVLLGQKTVLSQFKYCTKLGRGR